MLVFAFMAYSDYSRDGDLINLGFSVVLTVLAILATYFRSFHKWEEDWGKMMRTLIAIAALVGTVSASASETPTQFMERYVGYFNAEDLEQYQATFEFPAVRFTGGVLEILSTQPSRWLTLRTSKTGWVTPESTLLVSYQSPQRPLWWSSRSPESTPQEAPLSTPLATMGL